MLIKEIYKIHYSIVDRGAQYAARPIETNNKNFKQAVKKHLKQYRHAMDLSPKYTFIIDSVKLLGYGNV